MKPVQARALTKPTAPPRAASDTGPGLLTAVLARENLLRAMKRVRANRGAAGVDGLDIDQTATLLRTRWPAIRDQPAEGDVPATAGASRDDPEAGGRRARAWHPHGAGPPDPTGAPASPTADP